MRRGIFNLLLVAITGSLVWAAEPDGNSLQQSDKEHRSLVQQDERQQPHGSIDFETFRLISSGMTREEVLKLAGPPTDDTYKGCLLCSNQWLYHRDDGWAVEVFFNKFGQVASVRSDRKR